MEKSSEACIDGEGELADELLDDKGGVDIVVNEQEAQTQNRPTFIYGRSNYGRLGKDPEHSSRPESN